MQKIENMDPIVPEQPLVTVVCQVLTVVLSERVWSFSGECGRVWTRQRAEVLRHGVASGPSFPKVTSTVINRS